MGDAGKSEIVILVLCHPFSSKELTMVFESLTSQEEMVADGWEHVENDTMDVAEQRIAFLSLLSEVWDYKIGEPQDTELRTAQMLLDDGIVGIYRRGGKPVRLPVVLDYPVAPVVHTKPKVDPMSPHDNPPAEILCDMAA